MKRGVQKPIYRILNCYAGIGGNRKLWTGDIHVTAIEYDENIAKVYQDLYPQDTVIVTDAHEYLLNNYENFDFIWCSPPCPTHSRVNSFLFSLNCRRYPDMKLYQEILLLMNWFKGKYCIENVLPYYAPLIQPQYSGRHCFWANFKIPYLKKEIQIGAMGKCKKNIRGLRSEFRKTQCRIESEFDLSNYSKINKKQVLNNCVAPEIGLAIFQSALDIFNINFVEKNKTLI